MTTPVLCLAAAGKTVSSGVFMAQLYQQRDSVEKPCGDSVLYFDPIVSRNADKAD